MMTATPTPLSPAATMAIREYLEITVKARRTFLPPASPRPYLCVEDFVLQHGTAFAKRIARPKGLWPGLAQCCFFNAATLATRLPDRYTYCEGYALGLIPVLHAWVVDALGQVLDVTWAEQAAPGFPPAYYGVRFQTDYIRPVAALRWECALDNWRERFPLLSGTHSLDTALYRMESEAA